MEDEQETDNYSSSIKRIRSTVEDSTSRQTTTMFSKRVEAVDRTKPQTDHSWAQMQMTSQYVYNAERALGNGGVTMCFLKRTSRLEANKIDKSLGPSRRHSIDCQSMVQKTIYPSEAQLGLLAARGRSGTRTRRQAAISRRGRLLLLLLLKQIGRRVGGGDDMRVMLLQHELLYHLLLQPRNVRAVGTSGMSHLRYTGVLRDGGVHQRRGGPRHEKGAAVGTRLRLLRLRRPGRPHRREHARARPERRRWHHLLVGRRTHHRYACLKRHRRLLLANRYTTSSTSASASFKRNPQIARKAHLSLRGFRW
jgi:hypothetical protein